MTILLQILWTMMFLLFILGALSYAFKPQLGLALLKRAGVLCIVILIAPAVIGAVFEHIPGWLLLALGAALSLAAYRRISEPSAHKNRQPGGSVRHAERKPRLPQADGDHE